MVVFHPSAKAGIDEEVYTGVSPAVYSAKVVEADKVVVLDTSFI